MLSAWVRRNGVMSSGIRESRDATHVFLDGGKAFVPPESSRAFLEAYAEDVRRGTPLYVVERTCGHSYRMFADFDIYVDDTKLQTTHLPTLLELALLEFPDCDVQSDSDEVIICLRELSGGKTGAHLVWRDLRVDDVSATRIRDAWVRALEDRYGCESGWRETIDAAVYHRNGLRMPWSRKRDDVMGTGVYVPRYIWDFSKSALTPCSERRWSLMETLERCSLSVIVSSTKSGDVDDVTDFEDTKADSDMLLSRALESLTSRSTWGVCRDARVHFYRDSDGDRRHIVFSCVPPSRDCEIVGRSHRNNHVYFEIRWDYDREEYEIRQRCHSVKCSNSHVIVGYLAPRGHALMSSGCRARSTSKHAIADSADRWMARLGFLG
jgi:hypothetical protein